MIRLINEKLINENGAMENVLVTLFLVIIGVAALIGLNEWATEEEDKMKNTTTKELTKVSTKISE